MLDFCQVFWLLRLILWLNGSSDIKKWLELNFKKEYALKLTVATHKLIHWTMPCTCTVIISATVTKLLLLGNLHSLDRT